MELSELESFHFLFRSVWDQSGERSERYKINILDTVIYLHGFPVRWLFTSEKTGEVLRKKSMKPNEVISSFKSRAAKLRNPRPTTKTNEKHQRGDIFAVVWYKNEAGRMDFYRVDEYQLTHLLEERIFLQALVALQVFFDPVPFKGSGFFEHYYNSQSTLNVGAYKTYELAEAPPSPNFFDITEKVIEQGMYEGFTQSQSQANVTLRPELSKITAARELISISETQHDVIKVSVTKLVKLMEGLIGAKILKATFVFCFNERWSPFVIATKGVVTKPTASTARILMYSQSAPSLSEPERRDSGTVPPPVGSPSTPPPASGKLKKLVKGVSSLRQLSRGRTYSGHSTGETDNESDTEGPPRHQIKSEKVAKNVSFGRKALLKSASSKTLRPDDPDFIPPPQPNLPPSHVRYDKQEATPEKRSKRRTGIASRTTALQKILSDANGNETKVRFSDTSEPVSSKNKPADSLQHTKGPKSYMMHTEQSNQKLQQYKKSLLECEPFALKNRRPISAPHGRDRTAPLLAQGVFSQLDNWEEEKKEDAGVTRRPFYKKLDFQKDTCFGDYCGLLSKFLDDWELDESLLKTKDANGKERLKNRNAPYQIPTKSIYLCRSEVKYSEFDIALQENLEGLGHDKMSIIKACASNHIDNVGNKCRKEALLPIMTPVQQMDTKRSLPSVKDMLATSFVYRNKVYNDALSKIHPSRFYYTVPVCEVCHDLYTALDNERYHNIYKRHRHARPVGNISKELVLHNDDKEGSDSSNSFEELIKRARRNLKKEADARRQQSGHDQTNGEDSFKRSQDSSKIPWESTFVFEMNALQQGSVVAEPVSAEESLFLEDTDAMALHSAEELPDPSLRHAHTQPAVKSKAPLKEHHKSMTSLLQPTLGASQATSGLLKSSSQGGMSSWATLLQTAHSKGHRRKVRKEKPLRKSYLDDPESEQRRRAILEARRMDRRHDDLWMSSLKNPAITLTNKASSGEQAKRSQRRPKSAPLSRPLHTDIETSDCEEDWVAQINTPNRKSNNAEFFHSPPKGTSYELETEEDAQEFNDIKKGIMEKRGLHSVRVNQTTRVLCNGDFKHVIMAIPDHDHAASNPLKVLTQAQAHEPKHSLRDDHNQQNNDNHTLYENNLMQMDSSAATTEPFLDSHSSIRLSQSSQHPPTRAEYRRTSKDEDGGRFVSELLKNSPMSPQNIDYKDMKKASITKEVRSMMQKFDAEI